MLKICSALPFFIIIFSERVLKSLVVTKIVNIASSGELVFKFTFNFLSSFVTIKSPLNFTLLLGLALFSVLVVSIV